MSEATIADAITVLASRLDRLAQALEQLTLAVLDKPAPEHRPEAEPPHPAAVWEERRPVVPAGKCPVHSEPWRLVPAGVSKKTGKPYSEFWACPTVGCSSRPAHE